MRSDRDIEKDVRAELEWDPYVDPTDIEVSVKDGVVTLTGFVRKLIEKYEAENAAKRIAGVIGVANDIQLRKDDIVRRPDPEIAREAVAAIKSQLPALAAQIKVVVRDGWVTLEGQVYWQYQREMVEKAVRRLDGVLGVLNRIRLEPQAVTSDLKRKIEDAFRRNAEVEANRITVETRDGEVVLKGVVRSWIEREEAERVAWATPGVARVEDRIEVGP
jgi:osmotically-inducible protein OsmY